MLAHPADVFGMLLDAACPPLEQGRPGRERHDVDMVLTLDLLQETVLRAGIRIRVLGDEIDHRDIGLARQIHKDAPDRLVPPRKLCKLRLIPAHAW